MLKNGKSVNRNEHQNRETEVFWHKNRKTGLKNSQNRKTGNLNAPPNEFLRFHNLAQRGKSEYGLFDVIRTHRTVFNGTSPFLNCLLSVALTSSRR